MSLFIIDLFHRFAPDYIAQKKSKATTSTATARSETEEISSKNESLAVTSDSENGHSSVNMRFLGKNQSTVRTEKNHYAIDSDSHSMNAIMHNRINESTPKTSNHSKMASASYSYDYMEK